MTFSEHPSGLFVFDSNTTKSPVTAYTLVSTVAAQKKLFTPRQIQAADDARALYRKLGRPSEDAFQRILRNNLLHNCPITPTDASRALTIYGKDVPFLKGTTTQIIAAPHVPTFTAVPLPPPVMEHHLNVTLCTDFFTSSAFLFFTPSCATSVIAPPPLCPTATATPSSIPSSQSSRHTLAAFSPSPPYMVITNLTASDTTFSLSSLILSLPTATSARSSVPYAP